jgi:hypothetical protein
MIGRIACMWLGIGCLITLVSGCGGLEEFPVAKVTGVVQCEGKPLGNVQVFFEPLVDGGSAIVGKQGYATANEKGEFTVTTYNDGDGAVVGKHKVHVLAPNAEYNRGFKCNCELDSETKPILIEVKKGEANKFTLDLPVSRNKNAPLTRDQLEAIQEAKQQTP